MASILFLLSLAFISIDGITNLIPAILDDYLYRIIKRYLVLALFFVVNIALSETKTEIIYIYLVVFSLALLFDFVLPIILKRKIKGYRNKLKEHHKIENRKHGDNDIDNRRYTLSNWFYKREPLIPIVVFFLFVIFISSYIYGEYSARVQNNFVILDRDNDTYIIFGSNKEMYISKMIDLETKKLSKKVYMIQIKDMDEFEKLQIDIVVDKKVR